MALWLVRGGREGEYEDRFLAESRVCLTWNGIDQTDLGTADSFDAMRSIVERLYPSKSIPWVSQNSSQFWAFASRMAVGDLVVMPRKRKAIIAIGEIKSEYKFDAKGDPTFRHSRAVKWLRPDAPRSGFEQDLLYSFGAFTTICEIRRNDAEKRVREKLANGFQVSIGSALGVRDAGEEEAVEIDRDGVDLARLASDQIAQLLERQFKGHAMARLVGAILQAQGYETHVSPEGPDNGIDILAAPKPLGFGQPRLCVQVKSGSAQVDRPTLDQLLGAMSNVGADHGLLVAWGGFKTSVQRELPKQFFRVRLWDSQALVEQLLANYDKLPDELRAEIPLQRIWAVVPPEDE